MNEREIQHAQLSLRPTYRNGGEVLLKLLDAGADIERASEDGKTPLLSALSFGSTGAARALIERGADLSKVDNEGNTAGIIAARLDDAGRALRLVMGAGADIHAANQHGITPLISAAIQGQDKAISLLLDAGADISAVDRNGDTALDHARARALDFGDDSVYEGCVAILSKRARVIEERAALASITALAPALPGAKPRPRSL